MPKYTAWQVLWLVRGGDEMLRNAKAISGFSVDDMAKAEEQK